MDPSKYELLRNQTLLFFIEKLIDVKHRTLHDLSCQFGSKGFSKEMRQIAGGSQSGLKKFLSDYPSIFDLKTISNDGDNSSVVVVMYKDTSVGNYCHGELNDDEKDEAVEYFRERLMQYGIGVWVPIKSLLGHRSQAPSEVRHVSGQHITEFTSFLERHPLVFKLSEENVMLKEFENDEVMETTKLPINLDKEKILKFIEFYTNLILERGPMLVEQLFHASAIKLEQEIVNNSYYDNLIIRSPQDLKSFFQIHKECFIVTSNLVTLSDSYKVGLEYLQRKSVANECQNNNSLVNVSVKPFQQTENNINIESKIVVNKVEENSLKSRFNKILMQTLTENSCLDNNNSNSSSKLVYEENKFHEKLSCDESMLKNYLLNRSLIISNVRKGKSIVDELLSNNCKNIIAVDCEGINLGDGGKITLIQIGTYRGSVFIFDLLTQPGLSVEIKRLLEDESVVKVMHDCRNDSVNLYREFGIRLRGIFDTQAAHVVIQNEDNNNNKIKNISLNNLCSIYSRNVHNPFKDKIKVVYRHDVRFWARRPLTKQMIAYAASDVLCLLPYVYEEMCLRITSEESKKLLLDLTEEQILSHIQPDEIRQRRRLRKNEADLTELKLKIENSLGNNSTIVLSNREMRLLKHLELSELAKERLKTSLKVAKKLEKMDRVNTVVMDANDSSSSELTSLEYNNDDRVQKIDDLENIITEIIQQQLDDTCCYEKIDVATQTTSTGDVIIMKIFDENN